MKDIYIFHYALNCLYLEGDKAVFLEDDTERPFDIDDKELVDDFYKNFWKNVMNMGDALFITPQNENNISRLLREENNSLKPFSLQNYATIESLLNMFNGRLYNSEEDPRQILETIIDFKSKVKAYDFWKEINPSFLLEYEVAESKSLESTMRKMLKHSRVVVKSEYGQMGMNSEIISNDRDVQNFLNKSNSESFVNSQEIKKRGLFIVEPFFEHDLAPSVCFYITDDDIILKYKHDRIVDSLEYVGSFSPSKSPNITKILENSFAYSKKLQDKGYRGPVDFEFMEKRDYIKFCEINARYPISYYPSEFPIPKTYLLKKFRLKKPQLSFKQLNKVIGDYWFDQKSKKGIIPLNIPYFLEPKQRFALLFVGNESEIREMYNAASILTK